MVGSNLYLILPFQYIWRVAEGLQYFSLAFCVLADFVLAYHMLFNFKMLCSVCGSISNLEKVVPRFYFVLHLIFYLDFTHAYRCSLQFSVCTSVLGWFLISIDWFDAWLLCSVSIITFLLYGFFSSTPVDRRHEISFDSIRL